MENVRWLLLRPGGPEHPAFLAEWLGLCPGHTLAHTDAYTYSQPLLRDPHSHLTHLTYTSNDTLMSHASRAHLSTH